MDLYMQAVEQAADTWAAVRRIPDYELVFGKALFRHLFTLAPHAVDLFSFGEMVTGQKIGPFTTMIPEELYELPQFRLHAMGVVTTLGTVIMMMTGDGAVSDLAEELSTLGRRHVSYGVHPVHYQILETALLRSLRDLLGEDGWTHTVRKGWAAVFKFIGQAMQTGAGSQVEILKHRRKSVEDIRRSTNADILRLRVRSPSPDRDLSPTTRPPAEPLRMPTWPANHRSNIFANCEDTTPSAPRLPKRSSDDTTTCASSFADAPPTLPRKQLHVGRSHHIMPTLPQQAKGDTITSSKTLSDDSISTSLSENTELELKCRSSSPSPPLLVENQTKYFFL